jgi:excisionase family DNA binding protein
MSFRWLGDVSRLDALFDGLPTHLSVEQLAEVLGVKKQTVYNWLQRGVLPGYKIESTWVILRDEIKDYLRSHRNEAPANGVEAAAEGAESHGGEG